MSVLNLGADASRLIVILGGGEPTNLESALQVTIKL